MTVVNVLHIVGALMAFGLGCVYLWLQVALSFITLHRLSSLAVCIIRVLLAVVATVVFPLNEVFNNQVRRVVVVVVRFERGGRFHVPSCPILLVSILTNEDRSFSVVTGGTTMCSNHCYEIETSIDSRPTSYLVGLRVGGQVRAGGAVV